MLQSKTYRDCESRFTVPIGGNTRLYPAAPVAPRFGWDNAGHTAIEKASVATLPDSSWKAFLSKNLESVHRHSLNQDAFHSGPDHYVNLENSGQYPQTSGGPRQITWKDRTFENISRVFTPAWQSKTADYFEKQPLSPDMLRVLSPAVRQPEGEDWTGQSNAYRRIEQNEARLFNQLQAIRNNPPRGAWQKVWETRALEKTAGELAHYVADIHQPMHTSGYFSWPLAYVWRHDTRDTDQSHEFFERDLLDHEDLWQWRKAFEVAHDTAVPVSDEARRENLARTVETGHLAMADLVGMDRKAWETTDNAAAYFAQIKAGWRPMAEARMNQAGEDLATTLQSVYTEAGEPNLESLHVGGLTAAVINWLLNLRQRFSGYF